MTNAYSGSLAWTNSFARVTRHYPGRMVFGLVNLGFALALMEADMPRHERPDLAACAAHDAVVCSLCLSTDEIGDHMLSATA